MSASQRLPPSQKITLPMPASCIDGGYAIFGARVHAPDGAGARWFRAPEVCLFSAEFGLEGLEVDLEAVDDRAPVPHIGGLRDGFANSEHLPSYTTVNMALAKSFDLGNGFGGIDARLSAVNVFDRSYALRDGSGIGVSAPQFGARRGALLTVSHAF